MKDERPQARYVKPGEMLAMDPSRIHRDERGYFWLFSGLSKPSERRGDVAIVYVRGELEHHKGWGESYEGIIEKFTEAISGQDAADTHERHHKWDDGYEPLSATPPKRVIACIDSPGGVVAGLNECHATLVKLIKANPDIGFSVHVDEMAASAAFALACAFPEITCPRSSILGSIGVISTMISQARKNKKDGFDVELLTSGARKADGHLHAPITEEAKAVEMDRVMKLAASFWKLVSRARGIPVARIQSFEAGIFLGPDAVRRQLADAVMSFDDVLLGAGAEPAGGTKQAGGGNQTDRRLQGTGKSFSIAADNAVGTEAPMLALAALIKKTEAKVAKATDAKKKAALLGALQALRRTDKALVVGKKLAALISETEAAIAKETDEAKLSRLLASLGAYKKTEKHIEHTKSEEGDEDDDEEKDDDGDEEEEDDEEEEEAKSKSKATTSEEDDEEEAKSEEEEAKAALAAVRKLTGLKGNAALGALQALAGTAAQTAADVAQIKRKQFATEKASLIAGARAAHQITRAEEKDLGEQPLKFVKGFLKMRQKAGFVVTDEGELTKTKHVQPGTEESLPAETIEMIDAAVDVWTGDKKGYREELVKAHLAAHAKQVAAALNGAPGRY